MQRPYYLMVSSVRKTQGVLTEWAAGGEDSLLSPAGWSGKAALKGVSSASLLPRPLQKSKGSSLALDSLTSLVQRIKTHSGHLKGWAIYWKDKWRSKETKLITLDQVQSNGGKTSQPDSQTEEELHHRNTTRIVQKRTVSCSGSRAGPTQSPVDGGSLAQAFPVNRLSSLPLIFSTCLFALAPNTNDYYANIFH